MHADGRIPSNVQEGVDVLGCTGEHSSSEEDEVASAVERLILEAARQLQQAQPQQAEYLLLEGAFTFNSPRNL